MKTDRILRLASAAVLCTMLAACGGEALAPSSSSAPAASYSEPAATPEPAAPVSKQLTANLPVEGALTLTASNVFDGYQHVSPFFNGWAFVYKDGQAGYISEEGEYKPLYTVPAEELYRIDFYGMPSTYDPNDPYSSPRREELYWMGNNFRCSESGIVPYYRDGKWGYSDLDGNIVVEPIYDQVTWVGQVAYGLCYEYASSGGTGGISRKYYDIYNSRCGLIAGEVYAAWADPAYGYYFMDDDQDGAGELYNADGSLVMADMPYGYRNCLSTGAEYYPGGIVYNGVAYDRTGAELPVDADTIDRFYPNWLAVWDEAADDDIGVDLNGQPLLDAGLWMAGDPDETGAQYLGVQGSQAIRRYDAQFNELTTPPLLRAAKGTSYTNEAGKEVTPISILDQDGQEVMTLEAVEPPVHPVYYPAEPLVEGDWLYWCPDRDTVIPYRVTAVQ